MTMHGISFESAEPGFYRDELTWTELPLPSEEDALRFLGAMNEIDYDPGDWNRALVNLAIKSDVNNRRKLRREFNGLVSAVILYKEHPDGFSMLWRIANRWDDRPSHLRCGGGVAVKTGEEFCTRGLSCAQLGASPWTAKGCADA